MGELSKNQILTALCTGYTSEALGVVRAEGRAVFVKGLLMGESARVRITKVSNSAVYGRVEELLTASPRRISPDCPVYGACGGCKLRHMDYEEELSFKRRKVEDALSRIGGVSIGVEEILGAERVDGYRNKTIYTVGREGGRTVTGFYRERSHDLIPAPDCAIESDYSRRAAGALRDAMDTLGIPAFSPETGRGVRRLMCRFGFKSGEGQIVLVTGRGAIPRQAELTEALLEACPETVSIMRNINADPGDTVLGRDFSALWGRETIEDELCSLRFSLAPGAFYQVNRDQAERLYMKALEFAGLSGGETALDLYCGTGTITLCLAKRAKKVIGAEIVESAVANARENAARNGVENAEFICADAGRAAAELRERGFRPDVVVVDPPRKGLFPEVPGIIASMEPERIVYVSCDPATLARDLRAFAALGYAPARAAAVDMFPRTHHVETVVLMTKK